MINDPDVYTMKDDAILFYVRSTHIPKAEKLIQLSNFLALNTNTPIMEKLMWEQAKLAEQINVAVNMEECKTSEDCFLAATVLRPPVRKHMYRQEKFMRS